MASTDTPSGAGSASLRKVKEFLAAAKPRFVKISLIALCLLGVIAQIVPAIGDALSKKSFIGGSFAAFIAYVLFDAITSERPAASSGHRVLRSIDELRECASRAFDRRDVRIDFFGFTSETLLQITRTPMQRIADEARGRYRVRIRIMTPDLMAPMSLPCRLVPCEGGVQGYRMVDDPDFRTQMRGIIDESVRVLTELKSNIESSIPGARVEISFRVAPHLSPQFKLFLFNDEEACHGYYPIVAEEVGGLGQSPSRRLNPKGFTVGGMALLSRRGGPAVRELYEQHRQWFDRHWSLAEQVQ
ncbi:hypothetical protein PV350_19390 [Streptomyces sp. PA03-6a]|nr:hypothetical protein [Streptomyces sp. PA03-6a]